MILINLWPTSKAKLIKVTKEVVLKKAVLAVRVSWKVILNAMRIRAYRRAIPSQIYLVLTKIVG